jgi:hypothetical protein
MASIGNVANPSRTVTSGKIRELPADSVRFDSMMVGLIYWWLIGTYLDGWAHNSGLVDTSFFTPYHAVLYSGVAVIGLALGITQIRNIQKGYAWQSALPSGYMPALLGVGIFAVGGVFDLIWHTLFGVEANLQALLSPSHLILAAGAFLFASAPLRAAWGRQEAGNWRTLLPAILSLAATFSLLTFFTQYANFATRPHILVNLPAGYVASSPTAVPEPQDSFYFSLYGVMSLMIPCILSMSIILMALRRWALPVGTISLITAINTALMLWLKLHFVAQIWPVLIAVPLGGILADLFLWRFKPITDRPTALRWFAFSVPFVTSLAYLLILNTFGNGLWWQIHMWLGAPFVAGITGLFLSYLAAPAIPKLRLSSEPLN